MHVLQCTMYFFYQWFDHFCWFCFCTEIPFLSYIIDGGGHHMVYIVNDITWMWESWLVFWGAYKNIVSAFYRGGSFYLKMRKNHVHVFTVILITLITLDAAYWFSRHTHYCTFCIQKGYFSLPLREMDISNQNSKHSSECVHFGSCLLGKM